MRLLILCLALCVVGCQSEAEKAKKKAEREVHNGVYKVKDTFRDVNLGKGAYVIKAQHIKHKYWSYFFIPVKQADADPNIHIPGDGECCLVEWDDAADRYRFTKTEECK